MKFANKTLNDIDLFVLLLIVWVLLAGCTVAPVLVKSSTPSWDGASQNSGVIAIVPDGFNVTAHWRDRYNALAAIYGKSFVPPIVQDAGITPSTNGTFIAVNETVADFGRMNSLYKSKPK